VNDRRSLITAASAARGITICSGSRLAVPAFRWQWPAIALLVVILVGVPASASAAPDTGSYVVQRGDTLASIAARSGVSMSALAKANGIRNANLIYVGQILVVPGRSGSSGATTSKPVSVGSVYVVRRGDTLGSIAARHGTSVSALMAANGIRNPDQIYVGQRLVIGGGASGTKPGTSPKPVPAPTGGRWIDINLSSQRLTAYQGKTAVFSTLVSSGVAGRRTPVGRYAVRTKLRAQTMSGPGYYLPNVPYVMYFAGANAIHGTYWHNNFGHPMSHGCVNLPTSAAAWLYNWASIGTPVVTHY
jgi:LysM repeat protein